MSETLGEGNGTPFQYSCLENPMDGEPGRLQSMGSRRVRLPFHFSFSCIGEGNGNPLQCSCLGNPRDGGAWWAAVYGVTQSRTRLKWLSSMSETLSGGRNTKINLTPYLLWKDSQGLEMCVLETQWLYGPKWLQDCRLRQQPWPRDPYTAAQRDPEAKLTTQKLIL